METRFRLKKQIKANSILEKYRKSKTFYSAELLFQHLDTRKFIQLVCVYQKQPLPVHLVLCKSCNCFLNKINLTKKEKKSVMFEYSCMCGYGLAKSLFFVMSIHFTLELCLPNYKVSNVPNSSYFLFKRNSIKTNFWYVCYELLSIVSKLVKGEIYIINKTRLFLINYN